MTDDTRVYTEHGRVAHLLHESCSPNERWRARCGAIPALGSLWSGTGSQAERDRAEQLPTCGACARSLRALELRQATSRIARRYR